MRNLIYVLAMLLVSCGGAKSNYEKAIADVVQTSGTTKYDLKFKVIELSEQEKFTVADSIEILTDKFKHQVRQLITQKEYERKGCESRKKEFTALLPLQGSQVMKDRCQRYIDENTVKIDAYNHQIDSLEQLTPSSEFLNGYDKRSPDEILAVMVRCKYSIVVSGTTAEKTSDFLLSANGKHCYGYVREKEKFTFPKFNYDYFQ